MPLELSVSMSENKLCTREVKIEYASHSITDEGDNGLSNMTSEIINIHENMLHIGSIEIKWSPSTSAKFSFQGDYFIGIDIEEGLFHNLILSHTHMQ